MEETLILAVASGKGGVGKTMLTVACAHELSLKSRTLLIDLDFFNRGLSGLLREGKILSTIERPSFLGDAAPGAEAWRVIEVAPNLLHVVYPDLLPDELARLESFDTAALRDALSRFVEDLAARFECVAIVLDCHGGPDRTSFAAALVARHTFLISEPDRITFHGTLNFLRQLDRVIPAGTPPPDIRLIFNKVLPAFRARFLYRLYNEYLREEFGGRDLLAIFPLEVYLTKSFEETPVLTAIYPHSLLARKMRLLLRDLLLSERPSLLPLGIIHLNRFARYYRRMTLGKVPWFLNLNTVLVLMGIGFATDMALGKFDRAYVTKQFIERLAQPAVALAAVCILLSWQDWLDRLLTRASRSGNPLGALIVAMLFPAVWVGPIAAIIQQTQFAIQYDRIFDFEFNNLKELSPLILLLLFLTTRMLYMWIRAWRMEMHSLEWAMRLVVLVLYVTTWVTTYFVVW